MITRIEYLEALEIIDKYNRQKKLNTIKPKIENDKCNSFNGYVSERKAGILIEKSKTWLWRKRKEKILPFKKIGSRIYYKENDLFKLLT